MAPSRCTSAQKAGRGHPRARRPNARGEWVTTFSTYLHATLRYGGGGGYKLGLHRSPTSLPLVRPLPIRYGYGYGYGYGYIHGPSPVPPIYLSAGGSSFGPRACRSRAWIKCMRSQPCASRPDRRRVGRGTPRDPYVSPHDAMRPLRRPARARRAHEGSRCCIIWEGSHCWLWGRGGRGRLVAPDGSPGPPRCEVQ